MKSVRLDQLDSYETEFESQVFAVEGDWVALAESLFYPTSGGQEFDTGVFNDCRVTNVEKRGNLVWHELDNAKFAVGDTVTGQIDWSRRYAHMQQHTGQHLLSQAFLRLNVEFETKSVALGATCTIDFAGQPSQSHMAEAERLVNQIAYKNLAISAFEVDDSEISNYPLRRPPKVSGKVRLVQMGDWELSACGGTHLRCTAEAGPIKLLRSERIRENLTRVYFKTGSDAFNDYLEKHTVTSALTQRFSAQTSDLTERIETLQTDLQDTKTLLTNVQGKLAVHLAKQLLEDATPTSKGKLVRCILQTDEADLLQPLAQELNQSADSIALLAIYSDTKVSLLFTCSKSLNLNMSTVLKEALPYINGKGGGKPGRAQGGGTNPAGLQNALQAATKLISSS